MPEEYVELVHRWFEELDRQMGPAPELCTPDYIGHHPGVPPMDLFTHREYSRAFFAAIPDLRHVILDTVVGGDKVACRVANRGTHRGTLMGVPATGRSIDVLAIVIFRLEGDKVAEFWGVFDRLGMLQRVGADPTSA